MFVIMESTFELRLSLSVGFRQQSYKLNHPNIRSDGNTLAKAAVPVEPILLLLR